MEDRGRDMSVGDAWHQRASELRNIPFLTWHKMIKVCLSYKSKTSFRRKCTCTHICAIKNKDERYVRQIDVKAEERRCTVSVWEDTKEIKRFWPCALQCLKAINGWTHEREAQKRSKMRGCVNEKREKELELGHRRGMYSNKQARRVCDETKTMIHGTERPHSLTDLRGYSC